MVENNAGFSAVNFIESQQMEEKRIKTVLLQQIVDHIERNLDSGNYSDIKEIVESERYKAFSLLNLEKDGYFVKTIKPTNGKPKGGQNDKLDIDKQSPINGSIIHLGVGYSGIWVYRVFVPDVPESYMFEHPRGISTQYRNTGHNGFPEYDDRLHISGYLENLGPNLIDHMFNFACTALRVMEQDNNP